MLKPLPASIADQLALPVYVAPMFLVSGPDFVLASCKAGVLGSFPAPNTRTVEELEDWLRRISTEHEAARRAFPNRKIAPWAVVGLEGDAQQRLEASGLKFGEIHWQTA